MDGKLIGGWEFVWAAYLITWVSLLAYAGLALWRERAARDGDQP